MRQITRVSNVHIWATGVPRTFSATTLPIFGAHLDEILHGSSGDYYLSINHEKYKL